MVLLLRWLLRGKVSQRLIYGLWLLVALRLLVPIQFGHSQYSVTSLAQKAEEQSPPIQQLQQTLQEPVVGPSRAELYNQLLGEYLQENPAPESPGNPDKPITVTPELQQTIEAQVEARLTIPTLAQVLTGIWLAGLCAMAAWFLSANLIFLGRAKKDSVAAEGDGTHYQISPHVPTPCIAGMIHPTIHLTPACAQDPQARAHVLAHERAHLRHGDHLWALVRCVCLCIYWFNPLVWIAAAQSRRDCELACDESALKELGDDQRIAYGKTLLNIVSQSLSPVHLLETATAMNESKKQLKERVNFIVRKPRNILIAAICLILVAAITAGCAFLGAAPTEPAGPTNPSTQPTAPGTDPTDPSAPGLPTEPTSPQLQSAEALVAGYSRYMSAGLCCDYEQDDRDMSAYLSDSQKQNYHNWQYRITCCHSADEFFAHIDRTLAKDLQIRSDIADRLFTDDQGQLYLIVIPMGAVAYRNVTTAESNGRLYAKAGAYDEDGWFADAYFTIENSVITAVARTNHEGIPAYVEGLTFPLHIGSLFDKPDSWYLRALTSSYTDPADANIAHFFNLGFADEPAITDGEWDMLKDVPGFKRTAQLHRLPAARMDQALMQVFGLTLAQMNGIGLEKLTYLESTGCYYLMEVNDTLSEPHFSQIPAQGNNLYTSGSYAWYVYITTTQYGPRIQQNVMAYTHQVLQTTQLAQDRLGLTRLEFLYSSSLMLQEKMKAEGWTKADMDSAYWNAHSISNRRLYLENGMLMMQAQYSSMTDPDSPLYRTIYVPYTYTAAMEDLKTESYLWLFKMSGHVDGAVSDAYGTLLLDCAFAQPESFLQYLAEFDQQTIGTCRNLMYYGILSQEEADLFSQLLTALSSREDLNDREQRTLEILAQVPDQFPYSLSPALTPGTQGNTADAVSGQAPQLANGLVTEPPANTLAHTHVYTKTTMAPTCVVKGYDLHQCRCGAYYCDNFKGVTAHSYELSGVGALKTPTYDEPGYHTMECQRCGDRYLNEMPAGKDIDLAGVIAECEAYAKSLGMTPISPEDWNHYQSRKETYTLENILSAYKDGGTLLKTEIIQLIDYIANYTPYLHLYVVCISLSPYPYYSQAPTGYTITVTLGFE